MQVSSDLTTECMFQIIPTYASKFSSITMTMFYQNIWTRIRHRDLYGDIIPGQTSITMYKSSVNLALPV